jgi:hypothetical protein
MKKLLEFLKANMALVIGALVFLGLVVFWRESRWGSKYSRDTGALNVLLKTESDGKKAAEAKAKELDDKMKRDKKNRAEEKRRYERDRADLQAKNNALAADNETYKKTLAAISDDQVVKEFERYLKSRELVLLAAGHFSLTRPGAEKSLRLFSDGAAATQQLQNEKDVVKKCQDAIQANETSYENSLKDAAGKLTLQAGELTDCRNTSAKKDTVIRDLRRRALWKTIETWGGRGLVAFLGLKAVGVIK